MSDLDRNYVSPFGRAAGRVDAATVDAGLRSYMLRIYNYMSIGLAITGLAALGVYMAAVTTDQAGAAAKFGNAYLTPFGYAMYVSPLKWLFILAPLAMVFAISFGINRLRPATAHFTVVDLPGVHAHLDRPGVLHHCGDLRRTEPVRLHHQA
jgi:FtsH-binding integral membrane protein